MRFLEYDNFIRSLRCDRLPTCGNETGNIHGLPSTKIGRNEQSKHGSMFLKTIVIASTSMKIDVDTFYGIYACRKLCSNLSLLTHL